MSFLLSKKYNPNVESNKTRIAMTMYLCWCCFARNWASVSSDLTTMLGSSFVKMEDLLLRSVGLSWGNSLITWIGVPTSSIRIIEWIWSLYEVNTNMNTIGTSRHNEHLLRAASFWGSVRSRLRHNEHLESTLF